MTECTKLESKFKVFLLNIYVFFFDFSISLDLFCINILDSLK